MGSPLAKESGAGSAGRVGREVQRCAVGVLAGQGEGQGQGQGHGHEHEHAEHAEGEGAPVRSVGLCQVRHKAPQSDVCQLPPVPCPENRARAGAPEHDGQREGLEAQDASGGRCEPAGAPAVGEVRGPSDTAQAASSRCCSAHQAPPEPVCGHGGRWGGRGAQGQRGRRGQPRELASGARQAHGGGPGGLGEPGPQEGQGHHEREGAGAERHEEVADCESVGHELHGGPRGEAGGPAQGGAGPRGGQEGRAGRRGRLAECRGRQEPVLHGPQGGRGGRAPRRASAREAGRGADDVQGPVRAHAGRRQGHHQRRGLEDPGLG
eukprot:15483227-Alexandrium_andersonii.AAC.1